MHCKKVRSKFLGDLPRERQRSRSYIGKVCCKNNILDLNSMRNCHCWFHRPPPLQPFIYLKIWTTAVTSITPKGDGCKSKELGRPNRNGPECCRSGPFDLQAFQVPKKGFDRFRMIVNSNAPNYAGCHNSMGFPSGSCKRAKRPTPG